MNYKNSVVICLMETSGGAQVALKCIELCNAKQGKNVFLGLFHPVTMKVLFFRKPF